MGDSRGNQGQQKKATTEHEQRQKSTVTGPYENKHKSDKSRNFIEQNSSASKFNPERFSYHQSRKRQYHKSSLGKDENLSLSSYLVNRDRKHSAGDKGSTNKHTPVKKCMSADHKKHDLSINMPDLSRENCAEPEIIEITSSPQKDISTECNAGSKDFLSIPPIKHNPPELMRSIQQEEERELA